MVKSKFIVILCGVITLLTSCKDDTFSGTITESVLSIQLPNMAATRAPSNPGDDIDGEYPDNIVRKLRIMVFDNSGNLPAGWGTSNTCYDIINSQLDVIRHPVKAATDYTLVFIANEPAASTGQLNAITSLSQLEGIAFPTTAFDNTELIPMMQVITGADITRSAGSSAKVKLKNGTLTDINGKTRAHAPAWGLYNANDETDMLTLRLDRLGVRINVTLKSDFDMGTDFEGITISDLPAEVPLFQKKYDIDNITRSVERSFTANKFNISYTTTDGWKAVLERVVIPSFHLKDADKNDETKGVTFTMNTPDDKYSPSCKLKTPRLSDPDNYTLPYNTWLDFEGIVKKPLEVNIIMKSWSDEAEIWLITGEHILNVSHTSATITNLNGVRISFYSNMPEVWVEGTVKKNNTTDIPTQQIFNSLVKTTQKQTVGGNQVDREHKPYRFHYDPTKGAGYMDILLDGSPSDDVNDLVHEINSLSGDYTLTLAAKDANGATVIKREIKITVNQSGLMTPFWPVGSTYPYFTGAFYRHNQYGERIITGQRPLNYKWSVTVPREFRDWLTVSATPSFDPRLGTNSPGDAENYPVIPNTYKHEDGYNLGRTDTSPAWDPYDYNNLLTGRIYFRIGIKQGAADAPGGADEKPKFGYVELTFQGNNPATDIWHAKAKIYVRQGEAAWYIYEPKDMIPKEPMGGWDGTTKIAVAAKYMPLADKQRGNAAVKFSPYNLTMDKLNDWPYYKQSAVKSAKFVEYPTQAGAFFQWALNLAEENMADKNKYYRRAYNPTVSLNEPSRSANFNNETSSTQFPALWDGGTLKYGGKFDPANQPPSIGTDTIFVNQQNIKPYKATFEVCPQGYRRPTDGRTDTIVFNGDYIHPRIITQDLKRQIAQSEFRVSLFYMPFAGNSSPNSDYKSLKEGKGNGDGTYPPQIARRQLKGTKFALYSDGFFDRRPLKRRLYAGAGAKTYAVYEGDPAWNSHIVGYQGVLYYNDETNASLFFPSAGRINNASKVVENTASTGYYWSSSVGPKYYGEEFIGADAAGNPYNKTIHYGAWSLEVNYNYQAMISSYTAFGQSIRCVKDE